MGELPSGTVTFLFTDLEASTRLWEEFPDAMHGVLADHDEILRETVEAHGGHVVKMRGDGVHAAFSTADAAIVAAIAAQLALERHAWGVTGPLRVRVGIHTGSATVRDGDYFGAALNRAARLMDVAHGGQVVCSQATADLARDALPEGVGLGDLGEHRLRDLSRAERVFQVNAPTLRGEFAPLRSLDAFPGNLPLQVSSFIGREREIARTIDALESTRVVTLTGVGGVGKTRLAQQVAAEVLPRFREGAWLVELAPIRDPDGVVDAFAALFGVTASAGEPLEAALVEFLRSKHLLLVVDNCEHVLEAVADLVESIERSCVGVVVLATSREGLALEGEQILAVPSLGAPGGNADLETIAQSDAVRLFVERARAADAEFTLDTDNADAVVKVCRRLDGVPLAIELAAARVTMMSLPELASALDRRFEVLAGGRRRGIERHQTLRATIDWSYDLLSEAQRRLLARLSVFAGGCTREAAEAVCAGEPVAASAVFALLSDLVARSLVVVERGDAGTRYRLLETIRQYGEERLAELDETTPLRDRHAHYFVERGRIISEGLQGPAQIDWAKSLSADNDDFHAAMAQAVDTQDVDLAVGLLACTARGFLVGYQLRLAADPVLALPGVERHRGYPVALMVAAWEAADRGELDVAQRRCEEAINAERSMGVPAETVMPLDVQVCSIGTRVATATGAWSEVARISLEGAERSRAHGLLHSAASNLSAAANAMSLSGDRDSRDPDRDRGAGTGARDRCAPVDRILPLRARASACRRRPRTCARVARRGAPRQLRDRLRQLRARRNDARRGAPRRPAAHGEPRKPFDPLPPLDQRATHARRHPERVCPCAR